MKPRNLCLVIMGLLAGAVIQSSYAASLTWKGDGEEETLWTAEGVWTGGTGTWVGGDVPTFGGVTGRPNQTVLIEGTINVGGGMTVTANTATQYLFKGTGAQPTLNFTGRVVSNGKVRYEDVSLITTEYFYVTGGGVIDTATNTGSDVTYIGSGAVVDTIYFSLCAGSNLYGNVVLDGGKIIVTRPSSSNGEARLGNYGSTLMSNFTVNSGEMEVLFLNLGGSNGNTGSKLNFVQNGGVVRANTVRMGNSHVDNVVSVSLLGGRWEIGAPGVNNFDSKVKFEIMNGEYFASATHTVVAATTANLLSGGTMGFGATTGGLEINWLGSLKGEGGIAVGDNLVLNLKATNAYMGTTYVNSSGTLNVGASGALGSGNVVVRGGVLEIAQYTLNNDLFILAKGGLIKNGGAQELNFAVSMEDEVLMSQMEANGMNLKSTGVGSVRFATNNQLLLKNNSSWSIGEAESKGVVTFILTPKNVVGLPGGGEVFIVSDETSTLMLSGYLGLDLKKVTAQDLINGGNLVQFSLIGTTGIDFSTWADLNLNVDNVRGLELFLDEEGLNWAASYASLNDLKNELKQTGTVSLLMSPSVNMLVERGADDYFYAQNGQRYGASKAGIIFTGNFTINPGMVPVYGLSLSDNHALGLTAFSFQLDTKLEDQNGRKTGVDILGDKGKGRSVTLTAMNTFTGDLSIACGTVIAKPSLSGGTVTVLGKNNSVHLNLDSGLILDSGVGQYRYENDLYMNKGGVFLENISGTVTWAGEIFINTYETVRIENSSTGNLTLSGNINDGSLAGHLKIITSLGRGGVILTGAVNDLDSLSVQGDVSLLGTVGNRTHLIVRALEMQSGSLTVRQGTLTVGASLTAVDGQSVKIKLGQESIIELTYAATLSSAIGLEIESGVQSTLKTGGHSLTLNGNLSGQGDVLKLGNGALHLKGNTTQFQGKLEVREGAVSLEQGSVFTGKSLILGNNTTLRIVGDLNLTDALILGNGAQFRGNFDQKSFDVSFGDNSRVETIIKQQGGDISFGKGSTIQTSVTKPGLVGMGAISTTNGGRIDLNGITIVGGATNEMNWDVETVSFVLMTADGGFTYGGGSSVDESNFNKYVTLSNGGLWNNFLNGKLHLDGNQLILDLKRNAETIQPYAKTENQKILAEKFDFMINNSNSLGLLDTGLGDVLDKLSTIILKDNVGGIMDMVSGLSYSQMMDGQRLDMMRHIEAVRQRAYGDPLVKNQEENSFWVEMTQEYRMIHLNEESCGFKQNSWGGAVGFSLFASPKFRMGLAGAYSSIELTSDNFDGKTETDAYYVDLYANYQSGPWSVTMILTQGNFSHEASRSVTGISTDADGIGRVSTEGKGALGQVELGYMIPIPESKNFFMPVVGAVLGSMDLDAFQEKGLGNMSVKAIPEGMDIAQLRAGFRFMRVYENEYDIWDASRFEWRVFVIQDLSDNQYTARTYFSGTPSLPFEIKGNDMKATTLQVGFGFVDALDEGWNWFGDFNSEFSKASFGIMTNLGLKFSF